MRCGRNASACSALTRFTDALAVFIELRDIAARQIGQVAVDKFDQLLSDGEFMF